MSTRSTIILTDNLHIYHECQENEVCFSFQNERLNAKYEDPAISNEEWAEVRKLLCPTKSEIEKEYDQLLIEHEKLLIDSLKLKIELERIKRSA